MNTILKKSGFIVAFASYIFTNTYCIGQSKRPLSDWDKQIIRKGISNNPDGNSLNQLSMMRDNFPGMAHYYQQQIYQIYERNSVLLPALGGVEFLNEQSIWNRAQGNNQITQTFGQSQPPSQSDILDIENNRLQGQPPTLTPQQERMNFLAGLLTEVSALNQSTSKSGWYESQLFKDDYLTYRNTFRQLKQMVEGEAEISIANAIYLVESSYGNLHLTYQEYHAIIDQSAAFMRQWMKENNMNVDNPEAAHTAIQTFMGETMIIKNNVIPGFGTLPHSHQPFIYDYVDFRAEKDFRNYFLTKTLATGTGQCNTLPKVYLVLAEAMNVEAYLSFAPQHSFIKYKNNDGTLGNYETTVHWHMSDKQYMEELPISMKAIENRLYLDTLNKKQIIASLMADLANTFMREHWMYDGVFVNQCLDYSLSHFLNSEALLLKNMVLVSQMEFELNKQGITSLTDIQPNTRAWELYNAWQESEMEIEALGIQDFPEDSYNEMLQKHDYRGKLQEAEGIDTKSKKSLFTD